jgi:Flp pilus assembly protein TadG
MLARGKSCAARIRREAYRLFGADDSAVTGVASVELAIIAPLLTMAVICTADLGLGIFRNMQVQAAAQAGAEYAITRGFTQSGITTAVTSATSFMSIQAVPAPYQFCGCPTASGVTTASCNATCPDGSKVGAYVEVSAQGSYDTILPYPSLPSTFLFTAKSTARVQ